MDNGDGSSPTSSAAGLLPLFIVRSMPADEGLEEKLGRAREDNRRLAATLGAILADHPHLRSLATPPAPDIAAAANVATRDQEILGVMAEPQPKIRTLSVRGDPSASDSNLSLKDGYHWKKYGQKVTRDNPHPRGYFRCAFAPSCPVKKKVQRDAEDASMLVATYEGEHNHAQSPAGSINDDSTGQAGSQLPCSTSVNYPTNQSGPRSSVEAVSREVVTPEFQKPLVVEMVNWLVNDAEFMRALTNTVAEKILENFPDRLS